MPTDKKNKKCNCIQKGTINEIEQIARFSSYGKDGNLRDKKEETESHTSFC